MKCHFISAKSGTSKKSGNPYGIVEMAIQERGKAHGQVVTAFCDPSVAQGAMSFGFLQPVNPVYETEIGPQGPRPVLVRVEPIEAGKSA